MTAAVARDTGMSGRSAVRLREKLGRARAWLGAAALALCLPALAQQAPRAADANAPEATVEEVVVTGSRIAAPNEASTSPIQVVTSRELQQGGKTDVIDLINQLPQNFQNAAVDFCNTSSGCPPRAASPPPTCAASDRSARWCWSTAAASASAIPTPPTPTRRRISTRSRPR